MGTLRTFGWCIVNNKRTCTEVVVDLKNVLHAVAYEEPSGGATTLLVLKSDPDANEGETLHVDITIDHMEEIIHGHSIDPAKQFRTHGIIPPLRKKTKKT